MSPAQLAAQIRESNLFLSNGVREVTGQFKQTTQFRGGLCITLDNGQKVHWRMSMEVAEQVQWALKFPLAAKLQAERELYLSEIDAEIA